MSTIGGRRSSAQAATEPSPLDTRERIMLAAARQCEEVGLRRTTVEDVARRAGLGRATVYRYFQSKDALVAAIILGEADAFFAALDGVIAGCRRPDERLVEGFAFGLQYVRGHALLNKLLRTEPDTVMPFLLDERLTRVATDAAVERLQLEPDDTQAVGARAAVELAVRLVLSLTLSPASSLGTDDVDGARRFARRHLVGTFADAQSHLL